MEDPEPERQWQPGGSGPADEQGSGIDERQMLAVRKLFVCRKEKASSEQQKHSGQRLKQQRTVVTRLRVMRKKEVEQRTLTLAKPP